METVSDVTIVGAGPCGSYTALNLAKHGVNVAVYEEHAEVGIPCHCTGHLNIKSLRNLGLFPLPAKIVENTFDCITVYTPKGKKISIHFSQPITCLVNRTLFDKYIAEMAKKAGAHYHLGHRVESLVIGKASVKGIAYKRQDGVKGFNLSKIVVDAEGVSSKILKQKDMTTFKKRRFVNAVQATVEGVEETESSVEVFIGKTYAPGFYAWIAPKKNGTAKVGLASNKGNPKELLQKFIKKHPIASKKLKNTKILHQAFHPIPLGGVAPKIYSDGFLVVGDAASQVKPTTGGGVICGMYGARFAAEVAYDALQQNDYSAKFLSHYYKVWRKNFYFDFQVMLWLRKMLDGISDENLEKIAIHWNKMNFEKIVHEIDDLDFQGRILLKVLKHSEALAAVSAFIFFYLLQFNQK